MNPHNMNWEDVANARSRGPDNPPLPNPMSQQRYQAIVQQGLNPSEYYNPSSDLYAHTENAELPSVNCGAPRVRLPATLVQVDDGSMTSAASASNALNFSGRASSGRFPDRNMFSADARTMQRDMVSLVAGWLSENGFLSTALTLADEAGGVMTNDYHHRKMLRMVARHVEEGAWDAAHKAIERCRVQNAVHKAGDGFSPEANKGEGGDGNKTRRVQHVTCADQGIDFIMSRQQYLEFLEVGNVQQASSQFHKRLSRFEGYIGDEHYQVLASLLACRSISGDGARMYPHLFKEWTVARGRQQIVTELTRQADESLNPCAYVSSLSPKPEAGELSIMVSEALSYRIMRNNPDLASRIFGVNGALLLSDGAEPFQIPSLLKAASLSGDISLQLPPQQLLCCFDFNTRRPIPRTSLHRYYQTLPYTTYFRAVPHEAEGASPTIHQGFVHINAPRNEEQASTRMDSLPTRLTACAPLLSRSAVVVGTRSGALLLLKIPTSPFGAPADFDAEGGSCEQLAQLGDRVWALDTAVLGVAQSGDFCRRDINEFLKGGERLRPANGGSAEVFVGAVSGNTATVINLSSRKVVRTFVNDGSSVRAHRMMMSHTHRQRGTTATAPPSSIIPSCPPARIEHDAQRDLLAIALFSPNASSVGHASTRTSTCTNAERGDQQLASPINEGPLLEHCTGQRLLGAVGSEGGELIVFDVFNDSHQYKVRAGSSSIVVIEFSTSGNSLYAGYKDGSVRVIDTACGVIVRQFDPSLSVGAHSLDVSHLQTEVCSIATSSNGTLLAISYSSSTIHIIDLPSGMPLPIYLVGHNTSPKQQSRMCFGATSRIIVSSSDDGFLCVWDLSDVLSEISTEGAREGMTALMPVRRIPLRMGSALNAPRYVDGTGGASSLTAREHNRLLDAMSDVKYDRVYDIFVVTTEDGKVFFAGP